MLQTITVSTQAELLEALKSSTGGETILLNSGNYGNLSLIDNWRFNVEFDSTVTIAAADIDNPPVITGMDVRGASNLTFEHIMFDYTQVSGTPIWTKPFIVSGSDAISFDGCIFDGDLASGLTEADNGFPTGFGLYVSTSTGVEVTDSEIRGFYRGLSISNSDDVSVTDNDVHSIRMDGMNFAAVQGVVIEGNYIHDFERSMDSADHADMIQFWTAGTTRPSTDIVIRDNILDIGDGHYTQSIFMRNDLVDRGIAGEEMYYSNVLIEGNTIVNGHSHGITVGETNGLTITQNTILHSDGASVDGADLKVEIPRINLAKDLTNVTVTGNAVSEIIGQADQADWNVSMNAFVQDQDETAPGWYGDVYVASTLTDPAGASAIRALDTGMVARLSAGSMTQLIPPITKTLDAAFHTTTEAKGDETVHFDASYSTGASAEGTTYTWDFGDGTTATGITATHTYVGGGTYNAVLTVTLSDGSQNSETSKVSVSSDSLISMNDEGKLIATAYGVDTVLDTIFNQDDDGGIQLASSSVSASVARGSLAPLFGSEDVTISMQLDADAAGTTGEIMRLHGSFVAIVDYKGELSVRAWSSEGDAVTLVSSGMKVNDGSSYDIDVRLEDGRISLWIDDAMIKDAEFNGTFANTGKHDLTFGNQWQKGFFDGDITDFSIALNDGLTAVDTFSALAVDHAALVI